MTWWFAFVCVALVVGVVFWRVYRAWLAKVRCPVQRALGQRAKVEAPRRCDGCVHWDWQAGQTALQSHPPFRMVMEALTPAQACSTKRTFVPNEKYVALREKLADAIAAGNDAEATRLEQELELINPERVDEEAVNPKLLGLQWTDFGLCTHRRLVVANSDVCEHWAPKSEDL